MIVVTVHLASAIDGRVQQLARMHICNDGSATAANPRLGDYVGETFVGRDAEALAKGRVAKRGEVRGWRRNDFHVWNLVRRMLDVMGYDKGSPRTPFAASDLPLVDVQTPDVEIGSAVDHCVRVDQLTRDLMAAEIEAGMAAGLTIDQAFTGVSGGVMGGLLALAWANRTAGTTPDQLADHLRDGMRGVLTLIAAESP